MLLDGIDSMEIMSRRIEALFDHLSAEPDLMGSYNFSHTCGVSDLIPSSPAQMFAPSRTQDFFLPWLSKDDSKGPTAKAF